MDRRPYVVALFGATIFCSSFLLFQVQPIIGKIILPWYGGTPMAWITCLLFFQTALLAGYLYAHLAASRLPGRIQVAGHLVLLAVSLLWLPFQPDAAWKPNPDTNLTGHALLLLAAHIGAPFVLLPSTNPLLQRWYSTACPDR